SAGRPPLVLHSFPTRRSSDLIAGLTVAAGELGGLLGQDVAAEGVAALDLAVLGELKALLCAGMGLEFHLSHFRYPPRINPYWVSGSAEWTWCALRGPAVYPSTPAAGRRQSA